MIEDFEIEISGVKKIVKFRVPERKDIRPYRKLLLWIKAESEKPENTSDEAKINLTEIAESKILEVLISLNTCGTFKSAENFEHVSGEDISKLLAWMNSKMQIRFDEGFLQK